MLQDYRLKDFGERLTSLLRAAVLPAALSSLCYASVAPAAEQNAPAATPPLPLRKKLPSVANSIAGPLSGRRQTCPRKCWPVSAA
jgi:hypothetical protein